MLEHVAFEWLLPGHGEWHHFRDAQSRVAEVRRVVEWMRTMPPGNAPAPAFPGAMQRNNRTYAREEDRQEAFEAGGVEEKRALSPSSTGTSLLLGGAAAALAVATVMLMGRRRGA
eukprot:GDKH01015790.1.p5 GENE.GDKH01015790.1~~GDKH01015790.1.p5  ORF type:complete len:115 (-),score=23.43 GDKH01015790.1:189-533(-)